MNDLVKLVLFAATTFKIIKERRPEVVVAQNPPTFCPLVVYLSMKLVNPRGVVVVDSHAMAVEMGRRSALWRLLAVVERFVLKRVSLATVTHEIYLDYLSPLGVDALVFYDAIPEYVCEERVKRYDFICPLGGHEDEDVDQVFRVAERFKDARILVTGVVNPSIDLPANVEYKGFLPKNAYVEALFESRYGLCPIRDNQMTLPHVLFDFMAAGIPFFVNRNRILGKIIAPDFLYSGSDELINKIKRLREESYETRLVEKLGPLKSGFNERSALGRERLLKAIH